MIMWGTPVLGCALLVSALLLRRWPLPALAVLLSGSVACLAERQAPVSTALIVLACAVALEICYIAASRTPGVSLACLLLAAAGLLTALLTLPSAAALRSGRVGPTIPLVTLLVPLVMTIAWLIGHSIRQAHVQAELVRTQAAGQAALAERLRIAREVHDSVAHSVGIIAIQAGAGRRVFDAHPAQALDALAAIEAASRETLSGLRRMVTGLRQAGEEPGPGQAALGPAPGLADLDRLAAQTLDAGVRVEVEWHGSRDPLPADIDLPAFRIIQEAVTNVVRHAGTGGCRVVIGRGDGQLSIEVTDSGHGGGIAGAGYGITGMRERAALLGGDFSAGPRPGGGFQVTARLPLAAPATGPTTAPAQG